MELEKKKCRMVKKVYTGPTIKYHSVSMPLIEEIKEARVSSRSISESEVSIDVVKTEDSDVDIAASASVNGEVKMEVSMNDESDAQIEIEHCQENTEKKEEDTVKSMVEKDEPLGQRCERTFITFSDEQTFKAACPWADSKPRPPPPFKICPFTRQKAKYFDPVSQCPYNTIQAFKILRETYYMQLEKAITNGTVEGVDKDDLNKWMAWRQKEKDNKLRRLSVLGQNVAQPPTTVVQPVTTSLPS